MKKTIKRIALTITILFALIGLGGLTAYAANYITWNGSNDFQQTLINLNLISERGRELTAGNENIARELEQMKNKVLDKDNKIDALNQRIEALEKGNRTEKDQLKQAEKDMRDVKKKSEEVLNEFK